VITSDSLRLRPIQCSGVSVMAALSIFTIVDCGQPKGP
jgi:hypothetical protein